jgi:uroporphyrinogen-III synthase
VGEGGRAVLRGKRIVVTRAREQSEPLVQSLRSVGVTAIFLPLVEFAEPEHREPLDRAVAAIAEFDWVLFTSQNVVRVVAESAKRQGIGLEAAAGGVAVGCVGNATAEAARTAGFAIAHVASRHDGLSLARELTTELRGKRVLLPRSDLANAEMVRVLQEQGARVSEVVAYRTVAPPNLADDAKRVFEGKLPDVVLFFSPSAVSHLSAAVGGEAFLDLGRKSVFVAIGPVTEQALRKTGVERIVTSAQQTGEGVIKMLAKYFHLPASSSTAGVRRG